MGEAGGALGGGRRGDETDRSLLVVWMRERFLGGICGVGLWFLGRRCRGGIRRTVVVGEGVSWEMVRRGGLLRRGGYHVGVYLGLFSIRLSIRGSCKVVWVEVVQKCCLISWTERAGILIV